MGKAYHLRCTECDWQEVFCLGNGASDKKAQAEEVLRQLLQGRYAQECRDFIDSQEHVTLQTQRSLYRCRHCGSLQVQLQAQLHGSDRIFCPAYYCDKCGKMMGKIQPHMIKKQLCPVCHAPILVEKMTEWDISPQPEPTQHAEESDGRFFCRYTAI